MGEVYRAWDPRLGRDVAIKVLPADVAADADRVSRLAREARTTATLNHPNILSVFDIGQDGPVTFVVAELLEGQTLREALASGPLPLGRALDIAVQMATGLAAAHASGVVHRDLKPENVFITADGRVKVLDFGLAKASGTGPLAAAASTASTVAPVTSPGFVLGTVGYMSPEQLRGEPVDHRSDLFAFGAVLFEMCAGRPAFREASAADTISAVLGREFTTPPDVAAGLPPLLDGVMTRCLARRPEDRFQSTADLVFALKAAAGASGTVRTSSPVDSPRPRAGRAPWLVAAVAAVVAAGALLWRPGPVPTHVDAPAVTFDLSLPDGLTLIRGAFPAISDDGRRVAVVASENNSGDRYVLVRDLYAAEWTRVKARPLALGALAWSPDGRRVAHLGPDGVFVVDPTSGLVDPLVPTSPCGGPTPSVGLRWPDPAHLLIACARSQVGVVEVPLDGGQPRSLTVPEGSASFVNHTFPTLMPNGSLLFTRPGGSADTVAMIRQADGREAVLPGHAWATYDSGFLLFPRGAGLYAQPFDPSTAQFSGSAVPLQVPAVSLGLAGYRFSAAAGTLATFTDRFTPPQQFIAFDRAGRTLEGWAPVGDFGAFDITSDGTRVVFNTLNETLSLWVLDPGRAEPRRLTFGDQADVDPNVTADDMVYFVRRLPATPVQRNLLRIPLDGGAEEAVPLRSVYALDDVSDDRRAIVYRDNFASPAALRAGTDRQSAVELVRSRAAVDQVHLSPDGQWVAYNSGETGRQEVYVASATNAGAKWTVSSGGGVQPIWDADSRGLYYLGTDGTLYVVDLNPGPQTLKPGAPQVLFKSPVTAPEPTVENYRVTADGRRFVFRVPVPGSRPARLRVVVNWPGLLRAAGQGQPGATVQ